jgi:cytokinin dehydrogenase
MDLLSTLRSRVSGEVTAAAADLEAMSGDFGRIVRRTPALVIRPRSVEDVVTVVKLARESGMPVTVRGAAHSQNAQGLSDGGILLDIRTLAGEIAIDEKAETVTCLAGTLWTDIVRDTIGRGLVPCVLTNNLDVTVGGTLSVAGIGVASFKYAAQVDTCESLQVVTGTAEVVECDRTHNRELFDAVRAGLGLSAIITRGTIRLRRCKPSTRTFFLLYDDLGALLRDERTLMERGTAEYLESTCVPCPQGFRQGPLGTQMFAEWFFPLHVTVEYDGQPPDGGDIVGDLQPYRRPHIGDQPTEAFARRLTPVFELWRRAGNWANAHPWMETILPWDRAQPFISQVLANFPPPALGGGHILLWPSRGRISDAPLFRTPDAEFLVGFGILPGVPPDLLPQALPRLGLASDMATAFGGKRYLSGYLGFDRARWEAHFGDRWAWLLDMKQRFDPDGILNPGLIPNGRDQ